MRLIAVIMATIAVWCTVSLALRDIYPPLIELIAASIMGLCFGIALNLLLSSGQVRR